MLRLLRSTTVYRALLRGGAAHFTLVVFPDEGCMRALLKECAKAFFGAADGSRTARLIDAESYSDCIMLPPQGEKLTAERAASIADEALLRPVEGEKKLFVLDALHTAAPLVQNKLLKLLEEPPAGVYFLAGALSAHGVLDTVLSRANVFAEPPFSEQAVEAALRRTHPEAAPAAAAAAAAASGGVYSVAEELLAGGGEDLRLAARFLTEESAEAVCREIVEKKRPAFFAAVRLLLRDALMLRTGQTWYAALRSEDVRRSASRYTAGALLAGLRYVQQAERDVQMNANSAQAALALALRIAEEESKCRKLLS